MRNIRYFKQELNRRERVQAAQRENEREYMHSMRERKRETVRERKKERESSQPLMQRTLPAVCFLHYTLCNCYINCLLTFTSHQLAHDVERTEESQTEKKNPITSQPASGADCVKRVAVCENIGKNIGSKPVDQ